MAERNQKLDGPEVATCRIRAVIGELSKFAEAVAVTCDPKRTKGA